MTSGPRWSLGSFLSCNFSVRVCISSCVSVCVWGDVLLNVTEHCSLFAKIRIWRRSKLDNKIGIYVMSRYSIFIYSITYDFGDKHTYCNTYPHIPTHTQIHLRVHTHTKYTCTKTPLHLHTHTHTHTHTQIPTCAASNWRT